MAVHEFLGSLIGSYGPTIVGAALILAGIFLRLLGKGISYLILGAGIVATAYVAIWKTDRSSMELVYAVFLTGIGASVALALALRALTVATEFGFFTVGWFLLLPEVPGFPSLSELSELPGASTWMGLSIGTTVLAEWLMRRPAITRRLPVPSVAAKASTMLGARR